MEGDRAHPHLGRVAVEGTDGLTILGLCFELYKTSMCFPHVVPCYGDASTTSLAIECNLLNLVYAKRTVDSYRKLFSVILNKASITSLSVGMLG